jgi:hypothetical protein
MSIVPYIGSRVWEGETTDKFLRKQYCTQNNLRLVRARHYMYFIFLTYHCYCFQLTDTSMNVLSIISEMKTILNRL